MLERGSGEDDRCREMEERREFGAIGVVFGRGKVARVLFTVGRLEWMFLAEHRVREERKLIRNECMGREWESMEIDGGVCTSEGTNQL